MPWYQQDNCYNINGQVQFQPYSYQGNGFAQASICSGAGDTYSYDVLGRVTQITHGDNSTIKYKYTGRATQTTDENGVSKITQIDAFGRNTIVQAGEVTSITNQTYSLTGGSGHTTLVSSVQNTSNGPSSFNLGNGLSGVSRYDSLGRINGQWVCSGSTSVNCAGGTQVYGYAITWSGSQLISASDTVLNQIANYSYDQMNRLSSRTVIQGTANNFSYVYDRWGNRWQQNVTAGSGPSPQPTFNTAKNQISGNSYDAAGNETNDGAHSYTYDAEGNILTVDGGSTATYAYDALNRKVHVQVTTGPIEYVYDAAGRITSNWYSATDHVEGHIFWDGMQVAYRSGNGETYFVHKDWLQSDRMHTGPTGAVGATWGSLPFGDGPSSSANDSYATWDFARFGDMDANGESNTSRAEFRNYSQTQGRWLSPDPYDGSYDPTNPQSFNRYAYVLNNPLSYTDRLGLDYGYDCGDNCVGVVGTCDDGSCGGEPPTWPCEEYGYCGGPGYNGGYTGSSGTSTPAPPKPKPPAPTAPSTSYWSCVRSGLEDFSLQSGLKAISGGRLGNGWLAGAFLGNSVQSVGDTFAALSQGNLGGAANAASSEVFGDTAGAVATKGASYVPNIAVTVGLQAVSSNGGFNFTAGANLPLGSVTQAGAGLLSDALEVFGTFKLPYDLSVASFSGLVCALGR